MNKLQQLIDILEKERSLSLEQYRALIEGHTPDLQAYAAEKALQARKAVYGNAVYIRGLIEISNFCKNNCLYCGIRAANASCERYRLTKEEILSCCKEGYHLGFRTFVLQGGEDSAFDDDTLCDILREMKARYPDNAITLSLGEKSRESYQKLFDAGADRYLLRHETADVTHYGKLHPRDLTLDHRMQCLTDLKEIGYQVGCGFMVGSPYQTSETLAKDLKFIEEFAPEMCGIGPFIPHHATPFAEYEAGSVELTLYLLSLIRLMHPRILLPATTALGTLQADGRERGMLAGANVVMPNLSPLQTRKKYELYNNKASAGLEAAEHKRELEQRMQQIGFAVVTHRGDYKFEK